MTWVDALALKQDEKVVDSWQGIREIIGGTFEVTLQDNKKDQKRITVKERKEGLLVLTTQRLLFLEGQEPDGKRLGESVKVSLIDVDKVWFEKAPLKLIDEVKGYETHIFSLKKVGKKKEFDKFKKLLEEYIKKRNEQLKKETQKVIKFKIT
jgi:hypothetical protein